VRCCASPGHVSAPINAAIIAAPMETIEIFLIT
jgi:hypothetical protein